MHVHGYKIIYICVNDKCGSPYSIITHHCQMCVEDPVGKSAYSHL